VVGFSKQTQQSENKVFGYASAQVRLRKESEYQRRVSPPIRSKERRRKKDPHHLSEGARTCSLEPSKRSLLEC
jgi:hypothetical protein